MVNKFLEDSVIHRRATADRADQLLRTVAESNPTCLTLHFLFLHSNYSSVKAFFPKRHARS